MLRCVQGLALVLCNGAPAISQYAPPQGSHFARKEHPQIFLTGGNVPAIRTKLTGPMQARYQVSPSHLDSLISSQADDQYHALNFAVVHQVGPVPGISFGNPSIAYLSRAKQALQATGLLLTMADWLFDDLTQYERTANGLTKVQVVGDDRATVLRYHPQWVAVPNTTSP